MTFWRPIGNDRIHIIDPKGKRVLCGDYISGATGWLAVGDTPDFATCPRCVTRAINLILAEKLK